MSDSDKIILTDEEFDQLAQAVKAFRALNENQKFLFFVLTEEKDDDD